MLTSRRAFAALSVTLIPVLASQPALGATPNTATATLIRDVNVVTLDKLGVLEGASVLVEGKKISAIIPKGGKLPGATRTIDGNGKFLIPGMIDAHMHFNRPNELASYLRYGVTSVFQLGAQSDEQVPEIVAAMKSQAQGKLVGAHLYSTGATVPIHHEIKTVAEVGPYMDNLQANGLSFIKVYNKIPKDIFDAMVAESRRREMGVFGHIPRTFPADYSLAHGLNVVAHMEEFFFAPFEATVTDSALPDLKPDWTPDIEVGKKLLGIAKANDVAIIPNLVASRNFRDLWADEDEAFALPDAKYLDPADLSDWRKYNYSRRNLSSLRQLREEIKYPYIRTMTYLAQKSGILLLAGSDTPLPALYPGRSLQQELRLLVSAGLSNEEALRTATVNGGIATRKFVDHEACIGVIEAGCEADLVLLNSNPIEDIRNAADIAGVMADGRYYLPNEIDRFRSASASKKPVGKKP